MDIFLISIFPHSLVHFKHVRYRFPSTARNDLLRVNKSYASRRNPSRPYKNGAAACSVGTWANYKKYYTTRPCARQRGGGGVTGIFRTASAARGHVFYFWARKAVVVVVRQMLSVSATYFTCRTIPFGARLRRTAPPR